MPSTKRKKLDRSALFDEIIVQMQIGNTAVKKAQDKNRLLGIPNVYSVGGKIVKVTAEKVSVVLVEKNLANITPNANTSPSS